MIHGEKELKMQVIDIFKHSIIMGQNFHYEIKNRNLETACKEVLRFFKDDKQFVRKNY